MAELLSFDIDGTLETGNGPGPITLDMVRRALEMGYIIGSCSDRPVGDQRAMWEKHGIPVKFTVLKHMLGEVKAQFVADQYYHIGDTNMDKHYAVISGFVFVQVQTMDRAPWMGEIPWGPQGRGMPGMTVNNIPQQPSTNDVPKQPPVNEAPKQAATFVVEPWMLSEEDQESLKR